MIMSPRLRRLALTAHVTSTVGWLGAIVGFLALAITPLTSQDIQLVRGAYLAMELTGWYVLVPLCVASLLTGLIMSLGTPWGLFRYYWVLVKFVITVLAAIILFMYTQTLEQLGGLARDTTLSINDLRNPSPVLHSGLAVLALLVNTILSVYKPKGMTSMGDVNSEHSVPWANLWFRELVQRLIEGRRRIALVMKVSICIVKYCRPYTVGLQFLRTFPTRNSGSINFNYFKGDEGI